MDNNYIDMGRLIRIFLTDTMCEFKCRNNIPDINIIFDDEFLNMVYEVVNEPYSFDDIHVGEIVLEWLSKEENNNSDNPTIVVSDTKNFFKSLALIAEARGKIDGADIEQAFKWVAKSIFLRMTPNDFSDVFDFLNRQLLFLEDETFSIYRTKTFFKSFCGYKIFAFNKKNDVWDETDWNMSFVVFNDEDKLVHKLSQVNYGICEENGEKVCYVYAVQNKGDSRDKRFERILYKLKKDYGDIPVHPNQVFSLMLFMEMLQDVGISKIKAPTMYALDYDYHELLSKSVADDIEKSSVSLTNLANGLKQYKKCCDEAWYQYYKEEYNYLYESYCFYKNWYDKVYEKMDIISKNKTEKFYYLFEAITKCMELERTNDLWTSEGTLNYTLGKRK